MTAQYAAEHFEELTSAVDRGEAVEIERPGHATLRLVPEPASERPQLRVLGAGAAHLKRPLTQQDLDEMERDWQENVIAKLWMNSDEAD